MQFINIFMLFGLAAVAIPIIIQILTRRNARQVKWGAWLFLDKTLKKRKRKMLLEDVLLLACRCLACGLLALGFARPFVRPDSPVPWAVTLPVFLLAVTAVGISFALWRYPKYRRIMFWGGIVLFALAISTVVFERWLNLKRFGLGATKDVVLIVDGSASMSIVSDGKSNFERAIAEAKKYVEQAPRNTAFSVIIGGPVPQVVNPVPIADKRVILNTLDRLYPANGTMQIAANLTAAAVTLASGHNAVKQIVIVGDGQAIGWPLEDRDRWMALQRVFKTLGTQPIITWRTLPLPASIRNLAIGSIRPSRAVVGTDRDVRLDVTVVNAGTEAVTPKGVTLEAEGKVYHAKAVQQLEPGESRSFSFTHRFKESGGALVTAKVECSDDLPNDDKYRYAMPVMGSLKTLIVNGDGGGRMSRASTYVSLALRPELQQLAAEGAEDDKYLVETTVEDFSAALQRQTFDGFASVILCGTRRLSAEVERRLALFVRNGGGLMILPGPALDVQGINAWRFEDDVFLPAPYAKFGENKAALDPSSFMESISRFRTGTDLSTTVPAGRFGFGEPWAKGASTLAKFADGSPALMIRQVGRGVVIQSAFNFDQTSSLVAKHGFVPMMHELTYALSRPSAVELDVRPTEGLSLLVASGCTGGGLVGSYYPQPKFAGRPRTRIDTSIVFNWGDGSPIEGIPRDHFSVKWEGFFAVPKSGTYKFGLRADDRVWLRINGKELSGWKPYEFKSEKIYPIEIKYEDDTANAFVSVEIAEGPDGLKGPLDGRFLFPNIPGKDGHGDTVEVTDPHGENFYSEIVPRDEGLFIRFSKSVVPGVYVISHIPDRYRDMLSSVLTKEGNIAISVSSGVEESTLTAITQEELSNIASYVQISQALKDEDVIKAISGESFGKEVWRMLALIAFLFLVLEPLIARWIAINRRTGDIIDTESSWIKM